MKDYEFYIKYKTSDRPIIISAFYKRNWWQIVLPTIVAVFIEPLLMYKHQRSVSFTFSYYLKLMEYCLLIAVPFLSFLLWLSWREMVKRNCGYAWVGKFEIIGKQSSLVFCYLLLSPGKGKLKVDRHLFDKTRVGNFILIRRNALGTIEEIRKINHFTSRLTRNGSSSRSKRPSEQCPDEGVSGEDNVGN